MTSKLILVAGLVSLAAALMPAANAAQGGGTAPSGGGQAQAHSHVQEKTGVAPAAPTTAGPKAKTMKAVHDHGKFHK